ncbi:MAG: hypothetical protein EOP49_17195 [Sphingobacteriales bacterium]|nr:MAG: hypothetical protein EOP49_17195 [Sphingobacteriales bacterium]
MLHVPKITKKLLAGKLLPLTILFVLTLISGHQAFAQENVEINGHDVGSWFANNWMYVVGGVILLLLIIILASRSSGKVRKTTTVVKDTYGNVKSVTTTEEK